jgi:hypothetical protein
VSLEFKHGRLISTVDTVYQQSPRDRTHCSTDRTRRTHNAAHPRRIDRTRSTQRPDATEPVSGRTPVSTLHDRTRPIACDQTHHAYAQPFATHYSSGCPTGRSGPASDRMRRLQTLDYASDCCAVLTGRVRSNRDRVRCSVRSLLSPPFASVSFLTSGVVENRHFISPKTPESRAHTLGGRERGTQTPLYPQTTARPTPPLQMCQLHQVYISMCLCVSFFSIIFKGFPVSSLGRTCNALHEFT